MTSSAQVTLPLFAPAAVLDEANNPDFAALNSDQQACVESIFQFLLSTDKEFRISGPAGVGKTHTMKFVMQHTLREYRDACALLGIKSTDFTIALCATTNKATEVLAQATGFPAETVHSFMKLRVKDNYTTGQSEITRSRDWKVNTRTLLFIDEASMVDSALHRFILEGTDSTCKIIYLGDHCQMNPVMEHISLVYQGTKSSAHLTQQMRNSGQPALMALCSQLRLTTETLVFTPIHEVPGVIDFVQDQAAYDFIQQTFSVEDPSARILAYSNVRVQEYNGHIRSLRSYPARFTAGEVLVNNSAINMSAYAGSILQIEKEITIVKSELYGTNTILVEGTNSGPSFEVYDVEFTVKGWDNTYKLSIPENPEYLKDLIKYYGKQKNWERYFYLKNTFPDFRQKDAATVYKAQGSTYHTVFLDLTNIGSCTQNDQLARMLYVGASRATTRLVLYGELPRRLFI